jgi:proteasome accessory factor B
MSHTAKLHRWIDLITALLSRRYGATFDELRDLVPQYHGGSLARARRTFERDKDDLRRLGVPLDTHVSSADDESRYTITTTAFYLPYLALVTPRGMRRPRRVDRYGYRALGECQFTDTEVTLLADAAARVMVFGDPVLQADARQAMARLAVDLPADALRPTPNVTVMPGRAAARGEVLAQVGEAVLRR